MLDFWHGTLISPRERLGSHASIIAYTITTVWILPSWLCTDSNGAIPCQCHTAWRELALCALAQRNHALEHELPLKPNTVCAPWVPPCMYLSWWLDLIPNPVNQTWYEVHNAPKLYCSKNARIFSYSTTAPALFLLLSRVLLHITGSCSGLLVSP
jgi:hypothetical protein